MTSRRVHEVTWYGGQRVADAPGVGPRGALARTTNGAAFAHLARVWRDDQGEARGEWFDNGGTAEKIGPVQGLLAGRPSDTGVWRPFTGTRIPAALLDLAESAAAAITPTAAARQSGPEKNQ